MSEPPDAKEGMDQAEFKKKMVSQLQTTGVVGAVKSQLRAQLLSQLQKGQIVALGPPPGDRPGLKRHALNSLIADYMRTVQYNYSLSVFKEESGVESRPLLTEDEVLDVLKLDRETSFFQSYMKAKAHGGQDNCFLMNLMSAISEAAAAKGTESFTQTVGGDRYQLEVRMKQLEDEYAAKMRAARIGPNAGLEERLAIYRAEIEEQAAAEVARQVERIREMEVAAARLDEASKARRQLEGERLELDRLHGERLAKLRTREEEMLDKLRRQQRDVENVAYEHRQRILREEERLRNYKTEVQQQLDGRQEQLKQLERSLELRERAVASREAAAEKRLAEATEAAAEAQVAARQDAEREYMELKASLTQQRMQLEMDRSRILELRSEATAEIAAARAKEERLRALETARAEAEARAAAHAADAEVCRLQAEKLVLELSQTRDELSRRIAAATDGADAMLANAAGAMNMLNAEAVASRAVGAQVKGAMVQLDAAREEAAAAAAQVAQLEQERASLQAALSASASEAETLRGQLARLEALLDEAVAARGEALGTVDDQAFRLFQADRELSDTRTALGRAREEAAALRVQLAARRPPSRGPGGDSPGRRSVTLSPQRRTAGTHTAAAISGLSLGIALGGVHGGAASGYGGGQHGVAGGYSTGGGSPPMSQHEFPIAAVRDPTQERLERLRRQDDILASQEESYRRRLAAAQEVRDRGTSFVGHLAALAPQQEQLQMLVPPGSPGAAGTAPYMTYVMHGSPRATQGQQPAQQQAMLLSAAHGDYLQAQHHQALLYMQQQHQQQELQHQQHQQELLAQQQAELLFQHHMQHQQQQAQQQQSLPQSQPSRYWSHSFSQRNMGSQGGAGPAGSGGSMQLPQGQQAGVGGSGGGGGMSAPGELLSGGQGQRAYGEAGSNSLRRSGVVPGSSGGGGGLSASGELPSGAQGQRAYGEAGSSSLRRSGVVPGSSGGGGTAAAVQDRLLTKEYSSRKVERVGSGVSRVGRSLERNSTSMSRPESSGGGAAAGTGVGVGGFGQPSRFARDASPGAHGGDEHGSRSGSGEGVGGQQQFGQRSSGGEQQLHAWNVPPAGSPPPPQEGGTASGEEPEPRAAPITTGFGATGGAVPPPTGLSLTSHLGSTTTSPAPPPGLVMTSTFGGGGSAAAAPPGLVMTSTFGGSAATANPAAAKPTIPGLVIVRDFAGTGGSPAGEQAQQQAPPSPPSPPGMQDVENVMQAKMRMLQEQREAALAAQQQQQQARQQASRSSSSSSSTSSDNRDHDHGDGSPRGGASMRVSQAGVRADDSTSELIAAGEAADVVAPELSTMSTTLQRRTLGRRNSIEGVASRQNSVQRRDMARGQSFARSEASGLSVLEVPGAGGSLRTPSVLGGQTLDDIPSSLEGYELPGLHDDDHEELEGHDDDRGYGGFAAEFSAGSVF